MAYSKSTSRILYEEMRLLTKDSFEAISRLKKVCVDLGTHYVFINDHIGDVIITMGYLRAFREQKKLKHVTIVVTDKFRKIIERYIDDYDTAIYLDSFVLYRIFLLNQTRYGQCVLRSDYPNVTFINPADELLRGFEYTKLYPDISLMSMIKYGCFELDKGAEFVPISNWIEQLPSSEVNEKRIIFSNDSRTVIGEAKELYRLLAKCFIEKGFSIYTNTEDESQIVEGSKQIFLGLDKLGDFLNGGIFIGTRSGLHDLLSYYDCTLIALYFPNRYSKKLFSLESLPCIKAKYFEIEISKDVQEDFYKIKNYIL